MDKLRDFLQKQNIQPEDISVYFEAITHMSYANEKRTDLNYQRLEFLGDAVLDLVVSEFLFKNHKNHTEGEMSILRSNSVKGDQLAIFTKEIGLNKLIRVGNNTKDFNDNAKIHADVFESLIAAIYLDKGIEKVKEFLEKNVFKFLRDSNGEEIKNPKTILQEFLQLESRGTIKYETSIHQNGFKSDVFHDGTKFGTGLGNTKKQAEVMAAENALELLGKGK